jgi:anaerobic C4-dicarboxylate transporter
VRHRQQGISALGKKAPWPFVSFALFFFSSFFFSQQAEDRALIGINHSLCLATLEKAACHFTHQLVPMLLA